MSEERPLPRNLEAERAVLGSMLIPGTTAYDRCVPIVDADAMWLQSHKTIFRAIAAMEGKGADLLTVKAWLSAAGKLDEAGGSAYLSSLVDGIPDVANVERYARMVADDANRRRAIVECSRLTAAAYAGEPVSELAASGALMFSDIAAARDAGPKPISRIARDAGNRLEERILSGEQLTGISTGLPKLDAFTLGIQRGVESMLGARPRVGKTAVALAMCFAVAEIGLRALFFQLDMSEQMLGDRLLAARSRVSSYKIRSGRFLSQEELTRVARAQSELVALKDRLTIDHTTRDIAKMAAIIRRESRTNGVDMVIVDHIGHVRGGKGEKRYLEVGDVSARLIEVAGETNAAVLSLVQLGRDAENRAPELADLRESGNLEQDARLVVLLDRPHLREEDGAKQCLLKLRVPKNEGETGTDIEAHFNLQTQRVTQDREQGCPYCQAESPSGENELFG